MKIKKIGSLISMGAVVFSAGIILSSCTCKIKEDQLSKIAELRRQEKSLNSDIVDMQNSKAKVDRELQTRTSEYKDCDGRRDIVKQRLSAWPNIWPDYNPKP
jgi:outer membrane murein-binding lipoprotein Lpp